MMLVANARNGQDVVHRYHDAHEFKRNSDLGKAPLPIHSAMDLQYILASSISHRTGGRVRLPKVQILGSRVVVSGWAASYHAIQLALAGLLETFHAMGLDRPEVIELDIEVVPEEPVRNHKPEPVRAR